MTIVRQLLTNGAYGFGPNKVRRVQPVAIACVHITGNSRTAAYTDLHAAAQAERNYANRPGSNGPSSTLYIARDGWGIEAIDATRHAAWSNGDVSRPNTDNPGIRRVLALRAKGYNANEAYWEEYECVGHGGIGKPITDAQMETMAGRIAARSKSSGLPINRETVHGHWEINGIDRQNCPDPHHEAFLNKLIAMARGSDTQGDDVPLIDFTLAKDEQGGVITVKPGGATVITIDGGERPALAAGMVRPSMGPVYLAIRGDLPHYVVFIGTDEIGFVSENEVEFAASGGTAPAQVYPVTVAGKLVGEVSLP